MTNRNIRIMLLYHCKANSGYAIETLERVFWKTAKEITSSEDNIYLCYLNYEDGYPYYPSCQFKNYFQLDPKQASSKKLKEFSQFIEENKINVIFGFDQPPNLPYYRSARRSGVESIISYWGAPMSSINKGLKLILKRLEMKLYPYSPDLYIFESKAMQETAYKGRGIPRSKTTVSYLGVDTKKYAPENKDHYYAHDILGIERNQNLIFYSGHFEPRKGVSVIVKSANLIGEKRSDVTFILFGNKNGEEKEYESMVTPKGARCVFFGGYRDDLHRIHRSCKLGVVASIGWDSFTLSSLEIQSSGVPLIVSNLPGLNETIIDNHTGVLFRSGDYKSLADIICFLIDDEPKRIKLAVNARLRVLENFSYEKQIESLRMKITNSIKGEHHADQ